MKYAATVLVLFALLVPKSQAALPPEIASAFAAAKSAQARGDPCASASAPVSTSDRLARLRAKLGATAPVVAPAPRAPNPSPFGSKGAGLHPFYVPGEPSTYRTSPGDDPAGGPFLWYLAALTYPASRAGAGYYHGIFAKADGGLYYGTVPTQAAVAEANFPTPCELRPFPAVSGPSPLATTIPARAPGAVASGSARASRIRAPVRSNRPV